MEKTNKQQNRPKCSIKKTKMTPFNGSISFEGPLLRLLHFGEPKNCKITDIFFSSRFRHFRNVLSFPEEKHLDGTEKISTISTSFVCLKRSSYKPKLWTFARYGQILIIYWGLVLLFSPNVETPGRIRILTSNLLLTKN